MVKAKEIETAFFHSLGNPKSRMFDYRFCACSHIKQYQQKTAEDYFNYWDHFRE